MITVNTKEKGITLIALVITIVILLILAGITINAIINNGIIDKANEAKKDYKIEEYNDKINVIKLDGEMKETLNEIDVPLKDFVKEKLENEIWVSKITDTSEKEIQVETIDGYKIPVTFENKGNILDKINIPYKEKMTYYFDYKALKENEIKNFGSGMTKIIAQNAKINEDSIYFSGNDISYAYTEDNLGKNSYFTIYFIAKFDEIYKNNYCISTVSNSKSDSFGIGIGRYGTGTNGKNYVINMVSNANNYYATEYDVKNYYVYSIVYDGTNATFYMNGEKINSIKQENSTSKFYFASYLNTSSNTIYGGSLIRFKQFAFVDDVHTEEQIKANSEFLKIRYDI